MKQFYDWLPTLLFLAAVTNGSVIDDNKTITAAAAATTTTTLSLLQSKEEEHTSLFSLIPLPTTATAGSSNHPLMIFVMVGQSNTEGHGYVDKTNETDGRFLNGTLEWMVETYPETYGKLKNEDDAWKERDDVAITYNLQNVGNVRPEWNQLGLLAPGFGGSHPGHEMGPELGFGWAVGDALQKQHNETSSSPSILLLKVAWGGRSLAVNYRPPSSSGTIGLYYEAMLANVFKTLAHLEELIPGYKKERGYEISGFAWHQGWNDGCNEGMVEEYEINLANLIRDVRTDLGTPNLPISIGVSGMNGWQPKSDRRTRIIDAQLAVANATKYPEFEGTVTSVETRDFYREAEPVSPGNQIYHWNNNCESYWLIGQEMGNAMIDLIRNQQPKIAAVARQGHGKHNRDTNWNTSGDGTKYVAMLRGAHGFLSSSSSSSSTVE